MILESPPALSALPKRSLGSRALGWARGRVDGRVRDAFWALRTRRDLSVASLALRSATRLGFAPASDRAHLHATVRWLEAAHDAGGGGVAAFYDARTGAWGPPYPETTGYIIPTILEYGQLRQEPRFRRRALRMADWLLTTQLASGAFPIGPLWPEWERRAIVFDTGQIIDGLTAAYTASDAAAYLEAAVRAGRWLERIQATDGSWKSFTPLDRANSYDVRAAWALLRLSSVANEAGFRSTAVRHARWVLQQQEPDGWFRLASFERDRPPLTHTIAYTIEGLLGCGLDLGDDAFVRAAFRAADALRRRQEQDGFLRAYFAQGWTSDATWSCLPGTAQMALVWLRKAEVAGDDADRHAAERALRSVKRGQPRKGRVGMAGGVAGSFPVYAAYEPYRLLNWGAKFFADALLLKGSKGAGLDARQES